MIRFIFLAAMIFLAQGVAGAECLDKDRTESRIWPGFDVLIAALTPVSPKDASSCDSLRLVLRKIKDNKRIAGRQLEGEKPFDQMSAQKDLDVARREPPIRSRIENIRREVADENARLALEAAVLDEEGHYGGRDLLILQLRQRLN